MESRLFPCRGIIQCVFLLVLVLWHGSAPVDGAQTRHVTQHLRGQQQQQRLTAARAELTSEASEQVYAIEVNGVLEIFTPDNYQPKMSSVFDEYTVGHTSALSKLKVGMATTESMWAQAANVRAESEWTEAISSYAGNCDPLPSFSQVLAVMRSVWLLNCMAGGSMSYSCSKEGEELTPCAPAGNYANPSLPIASAADSSGQLQETMLSLPAGIHYTCSASDVAHGNDIPLSAFSNGGLVPSSPVTDKWKMLPRWQEIYGSAVSLLTSLANDITAYRTCLQKGSQSVVDTLVAVKYTALSTFVVLATGGVIGGMPALAGTWKGAALTGAIGGAINTAIRVTREELARLEVEGGSFDYEKLAWEVVVGATVGALANFIGFQVAGSAVQSAAVAEETLKEQIKRVTIDYVQNALRQGAGSAAREAVRQVYLHFVNRVDEHGVVDPDKSLDPVTFWLNILKAFVVGGLCGGTGSTECPSQLKNALTNFVTGGGGPTTEGSGSGSIEGSDSGATEGSGSGATEGSGNGSDSGRVTSEYFANSNCKTETEGLGPIADCQTKSSCKSDIFTSSRGFYIGGFCPGPSDIVCCLDAHWDIVLPWADRKCTEKGGRCFDFDPGQPHNDQQWECESVHRYLCGGPTARRCCIPTEGSGDSADADGTEDADDTDGGD